MYTISFLLPNPFKTVSLERVMNALASIPYYRDTQPIQCGITRLGTTLVPHENIFKRSEKRYNGWVYRGDDSDMPSFVSYRLSPFGWLKGEAHVSSEAELRAQLDTCLKDILRELQIDADEMYQYEFPYADRHEEVWIGALVGAYKTGGGLQVPYIPVKSVGEPSTEPATHTCLPNPYIFPVADLLFAMWDAKIDSVRLSMPNGYTYAAVSHEDNTHAAFMVYRDTMDLQEDIAPNGWFVSNADSGATEASMEALAQRLGGEPWYRAVEPQYATRSLKPGTITTIPTNPEYYMTRIFPEY